MLTCLVIQPIFDQYKNLKKNTRIENIQEAISLVESVGKLKVGNNFTLKVRKVFSGTFFSKDSLNFIFDSLAESSAGLVFINSNIFIFKVLYLIRNKGFYSFFFDAHL